MNSFIFSISNAEEKKRKINTLSYIGLIYGDNQMPRVSIIGFKIEQFLLIGDVGTKIEICNIKNNFICVFAKGEVEFAVPRFKKIKLGQKWTYKGKNFKVIRKIPFPYSAPIVTVFAIKSFEPIESTYYYNRENGLVAYTYPLTKFKNQKRMVQVLMPQNDTLCGIGCKNFDKRIK